MKIKNLKHLVEVLRDCKDEFIVFEFAGHSGETPVFVRKDLVAATEDSQGSPDTLAVWNAK